jgi:hypothetical protein
LISKHVRTRNHPLIDQQVEKIIEDACRKSFSSLNKFIKTFRMKIIKWHFKISLRDHNRL